ncbi:hypothetical protein QW180_22060 [Vibrio sinaloensis]|nr:hypothetical protein [Vibrio sinaloensis]
MSCGQGISIVPASAKKLSPENVVVIPLDETIRITTVAVAWNTTNPNALVEAAVEWLTNHSPLSDSISVSLT